MRGIIYLLSAALLVAGCSSSDDSADTGAGGTANQGDAGQGGQQAGGAAQGGAAGQGGAGQGGQQAGGAAQGGAGQGGQQAGGAAGGSNPAAECSAVRASLLSPIDAVSAGEVKIESGAGTEPKVIYIDASAGGSQEAAQNPAIYIDFAASAAVALTDLQAPTSQAWDLAIKRPVLYTNSGTGGPGMGGAVFLDGALFDAVDKATAEKATLTTENFWSSDCIPTPPDPTGAVQTSFSGWYDYDEAAHTLTPRKGTWVLRGASGALYKIEIQTYYAAAGGGTGMSGGRYRLLVAAF